MAQSSFWIKSIFGWIYSRNTFAIRFNTNAFAAIRQNGLTDSCNATGSFRIEQIYAPACDDGSRGLLPDRICRSLPIDPTGQPPPESQPKKRHTCVALSPDQGRGCGSA